jgi:galactofuranose transport system ATP-binding protein
MISGSPLLSMQAICKSFGGIPALREASLEIIPAEVMALVGQNGAGKSTIIKILNGAYKLDSGTIRYDGKPWLASSPHFAQRAGISTIFQEINLVRLRSVAENIFLGREPQRRGWLIDWRRMNNDAQTLLHRFGIDIDVTAPLGSFSTAVQQMVAIARAISFDAKLLIMDEPTSSLAEAEVELLLATVRQLKAEGVAVIFVGHRLDELYRVCDRVTIMRDGRTAAVAEMGAMPKLKLVATMLGRDLVEVKASGATAFSEHASDVGDQLLAADHLASGPHLHDATLNVRFGEIIGLAGLLGSGRSETARAIFGAEEVSQGKLSFAGQPRKFTAPADAIAAGIGFCPEDRKVEGIIPNLSVAANITLALAPALARSGVIDETKQNQIVERFVRELGIKCASPQQPIRELSGGNQQKVILARWLCMNPKLLILDEPTRGIDVGAKAEIQQLIRRLASEGLGVLMISSELEEIVEGADRVFVMREGRTVTELRGRQISEDNVMHAMAHGSAVHE